MATILIFFEWYYREIPKKFYRAWKNYIWFWTYYFSLKQLFRTFFSPWRRYTESYGRGLDFGRIISTFIWNIFSRFIGAIMRFFLILVSLIIELLTLIFGFLFFIVWPFFPLILLASFVFGIIYI
jgi:hypothetical protein